MTQHNHNELNGIAGKILQIDPLLKPYESILRDRIGRIRATEKRLTG